MATERHYIVAGNLAAALLAGSWTRTAMAHRMETLLGHATRKSQRQLLRELFGTLDAAYPPSHETLASTIAGIPAFERAASPHIKSAAPLRMELRSPRFAPVPAFSGLDVPHLATPGDIADWLGLSAAQLEWFADHRRQHGSTTIPILQHYTYAFRKKALGPPRLIEAPKPRLMTMQRRILSEIVGRVPAHDAAYGFVPGRSCAMGARIHAGASVVACFDIKDFFLTTPLGRVHALFRSLGYPHAAARVLTGLCSTATPARVLDRVPNAARHSRAALAGFLEPHLPQGAPTSPALANLVAWRLDRRLSGLARSFGARYSRYADDLTFSGDAALAEKTASLAEAVAAIVLDEGYELNARKTRIMTQAQRQQVTGIVVNAHPNVPRDSYERLKATLHNCRLNGLEAENRDGHPDFRAHLEGRVGWVESLNPRRGQRLRALLDAIA